MIIWYTEGLKEQDTEVHISKPFKQYVTHKANEIIGSLLLSS